MDKDKLIEKLNQAIALELGALLQYNQYSHVITGTERRVWHEFFEETATEAFTHARRFAKKVVALGGVPTVEPEAVKQTRDLTEMLTNSLAVERRAVQLYTEALDLCSDHAGYRNLLEDQIQEETDDVEELEKYLNQTRKSVSAIPAQKASKTG